MLDRLLSLDASFHGVRIELINRDAMGQSAQENPIAGGTIDNNSGRLECLDDEPRLAGEDVAVVEGFGEAVRADSDERVLGIGGKRPISSPEAEPDVRDNRQALLPIIKGDGQVDEDVVLLLYQRHVVPGGQAHSKDDLKDPQFINISLGV
jgi:hypothetical protein